MRKPKEEAPPKDLSFDEKLKKIQRYLPKGLTEKILSQKERIEGERKQVTVMFCDMEGFTPLTERLGPDEAYGIMDQVYEILIHRVHHYEGTVNEMTGDGIMALFGAPIALEDAPQRAIRSALSIHREMSKFSDRIRKDKEDIQPLRMRVGIHTGPVVVGTVGNDLRVEFKAVGDTVNLASRMEGLAQPSATLVTEDVFKLTEGLFRFEALGEKKVKGKEAPVNVYQVIAPSSRRTRFDVSAERGLTPFVGRKRDLELLHDALERCKTGRGQAVSIVGDAGVGKSRFLYEFRKDVSSQDVTFLEGKSLSYSRNVAYHPIIDILKSNFDIHDEDDDAKIREKVKKGLEILGADEASTLPYLLELLSVKDSGIDEIPLSPEAKRNQIIEALKRITLKGSEIRPLIFAFEDLHWIDKSSEECLKLILDSISTARVLLILTYRPDFVLTWGARSFHSQVTLNRLSNRQTLEVVAHILRTEDIESDLIDFILEKTEGIPLFIEEYLKSLKDLNLIEKRDTRYGLVKHIMEVTIPSTIQDVIMARVDSLPEGAKELLQIGSVIEREFSYELIRTATGLSEIELLPDLSILKDAELLYERGIYPEVTYIFKHALTRDVVYDSILSQRRKSLHAEIGNAIEELYRESIHEYFGILAEHYVIGEDWEKGAEYSKLAAEDAERAGSIGEAIAYARKRVASLERLPRADDVQKWIIDGRTALGVYMLRMFYYADAKEAVEPIIELASMGSYRTRLPQILTIIGNYEYVIEEDVPKAFGHLEEAVKISEELDDKLSLGFANWRLGLARSLNCEFEKAAHCFQNVLGIMKAANNLWGMSVIKSYLSYFAYFFWGRINLSYRFSNEALRMSEESGDIYSKALAYVTYGASCYGKGLLEEAERHLLMGIDFCERIGMGIFSAVARTLLGEVFYEIGDYRSCKEHFAKTVWLVEQSRGFLSYLTLAKMGVEMARVMLNDEEVNLEQLYGYVYGNRLKMMGTWKMRYIGEILLNIDDERLFQAEDWIKKAIETHKQNSTTWYLARDYTLYAELFKRKGDKPKAKENLIKAMEIFEECGADGWVKKTEEELASLS